MKLRYWITGVCLCGLLLASVLPARAAGGGDLDPTFGTGGKVVLDVAGGIFLDIALQPDGKLVVAGAAGGDFWTARYLKNGALDPAFGNGGVVAGDLGEDITVQSLVVQPDGKVVVAGYDKALMAIALARYHSDGTLDLTFGDGGHVSTQIGQTFPVYFATVSKLVPMRDGRLLAFGSLGMIAMCGPPSIVVRYTATGRLDYTFTEDGVFYSGLGIMTALFVQPDGKILTTNTYGCNGGMMVPQRVLARYNFDGSSDPSFYLENVGVHGSDIASQPDGKILVVEVAYPSTPVLRRYLSTGDLDLTFGGAGYVELPAGYSYSQVISHPSGVILVAGNEGNDFVLASYNPDGSPDTTFGEMGVVHVDFGSDNESVQDMAVQPDGRVILAGNSGDHVALARFLNLQETPALILDKVATMPPVLLPDMPATYRLLLYGEGVSAQLRDALPANLNYVSDTLTSTLTPAAVYSPTADAVLWEGVLPTGAVGMVQFQAVPRVVSAKTLVFTNTAWLSTTGNVQVISSTAAVTVQLPPLSILQQVAPNRGVRNGDPFTYTLMLFGPGLPAHLADPLPSAVDYVSGSLTSTLASPAIFAPASRSVVWEGILPADTVATVQFQVVPRGDYTTSLFLALPILNTAWLSDDRYQRSVSATTMVNARPVYLPLLMR